MFVVASMLNPFARRHETRSRRLIIPDLFFRVISLFSLLFAFM